MPRWLPTTLFSLLLLALTGAMAPGILARAPLYTDKSLRQTVRISLNKLSTYYGWPLSDMLLQEVGGNTFRMILRQHIRGSDPRHCGVYYFVTSTIAPCEETSS